VTRRAEPRQRALACFQIGGFSLVCVELGQNEKPVETGSTGLVSRRTSRKRLAYLPTESRVNAAGKSWMRVGSLRESVTRTCEWRGAESLPLEPDHSFDVISLGKHVERNDLAKFIACVEQLAQIASKGSRVARDVGDTPGL